MAAPAVDDVVIVPHHDRGHPRQKTGDLGLAVELGVAPEEIVFRRGPHLLGEGIACLRVEAGVRPGRERRVGLDDPVGIKLIPAVEQEAEGGPVVLLSEPPPQAVPLGDRSLAVFMLPAIAGDIGDAEIPGEVGGNPMVDALQPIEGVARGREVEVVAPDDTAEAGAELDRKDGVAAQRPQRRRRR